VHRAGVEPQVGLVAGADVAGGVDVGDELLAGLFGVQLRGQLASGWATSEATSNGT